MGLKDGSSSMPSWMDVSSAIAFIEHTTGRTIEITLHHTGTMSSKDLCLVATAEGNQMEFLGARPLVSALKVLSALDGGDLCAALLSLVYVLDSRIQAQEDLTNRPA